MKHKKEMSGKEMRLAILQGKAKLLRRVGVQRRPVYQIDDKIYEQAIYFDDGYTHSHFYLKGND